MNVVCHHPDLHPFVRPGGLEEWMRLREKLESWATLELTPGAHGLFAAVPGGGRNQLSGYESVWLRDNVHIAHALWRSGDTTTARRTLEALLDYQLRHIHRFRAALADRLDPQDPMQRPHVRFHPGTLEESDERWAHAQNDALGYVMWLAAKMWEEGVWQPTAEILELLGTQVAYFRWLRYESDRDSGHWEEERALRSSSMGTVVAAVDALRRAAQRAGLGRFGPRTHQENQRSLTALANGGRTTLQQRLPQETPGKREADAALLFLIQPLEVMDEDQANAVVNLVRRDLWGDYGIKRYVGDSYWCGDYRRLVPAEKRSSEYADSTAERDALLHPGEEAQWCIFDPVLSVHFGRRYAITDDPADREHQRLHLRRALGQITGPGEWCDAGLCPEAYFLESRVKGVYRPNDQTPLAWTQANLRWALTEYEKTRS